MRRRLPAPVLPADDSSCGWIDAVPAPPAPRRLQGEEHADCAVVGAGFTGLAAARRLAELEPGWRVAVVEAQRAGFGAAGRSSGFVVDLAGFIAAMPPAHAERFIRLSRAGIAELRSLVAEHRIDCDWDESGFVHAAAGETGLASMESLQNWLAGRGERFLRLDRDGMKGLTGSSFYRAGLRLPGSVMVQAAALVRGLADSLPENVELFEESPVRAVERRGTWRLDAADGRLFARRLVVATGGYAPGFLPRRIFPLLTFGTLTEPLTASQREALGGEETWGILAQDPMGSSLRRTRDHRLLVRSYVSYDRRARAGEAPRRRARTLHAEALRKRFPELDGVELGPTWAGVMGISPNYCPFFGRLGEDAVAAAGYTGAGIAMGTVSGRLLAEYLTGRGGELLTDRLALPRPRWLPPEPFLSLGIQHRVDRMNASAGETL